jgi:glycerol-3-phosphate dehydrogenase
MDRSECLARLSDPSEEWDLLVIGGGATGLGIAVDAASRGYRTALLEQGDFAESTSSKSTKLIHGGVRYLRGGEVGLVRESLRERGRLLRNAPSLVKPLSFVVPAYRWYEPAWYGTGLTLYDLLAGQLGIGSTEHLSDRETVKRIPNLRSRGLRGGTLYWDGQFDDARLALAMAKTAVKHGAAVVNHARVEELVKEGGRVTGVEATDRIGGDSFRVHAKVVVNATGVFTDSVLRMDDPEAEPMIAPSQGIHIVLDRKFLGGNTAIMIPSTDDGRVLFAIPWHNRVLLGTTDTGGVPVELNPRPMAGEVDYLIEHAGRYLVEKPVHSDVRSAFAGLRPLVKPGGEGGGATSRISRSHSLVVSESGLVTMAGGKWTTYRQMAEDAIDRAAEVGGLPAKSCVTANLGLEDEREGTPEENSLLDPDLPCTERDIERAVNSEMAMNLEDVLSRRTRSLLLDVEAAKRIAPGVATRMAQILGQGNDWQREQLAAFAAALPSYSPPTSQRPSEGESEGS